MARVRATFKYKKMKKVKENIFGYGLSAPALILIFGIGIIPIIITMSYSFQYRVLTDPTDIHFVGLENYITLITSKNFWEVLKNTAVFAVISMVVELLVGLAGALFMDGAKKYVGLIRTIILIPWAIPGIIIAYMFSFLFNDQLSVINVILEGLKIIDEPIVWLADRHFAMFVVILADTWKQFPYVALMLLAGLQTIPKEQYEAASVDGAGDLQKFFRITLPNLKGIIMIVLLFRTMGAVRIFDIIYGITGGGPANSTATLLYKAYKLIFGDMNFGLGSAMSTIITLIIILLSTLYVRTLGNRE